MKTVHIIAPWGEKNMEAVPGETLREALLRAGIPGIYPCGGGGRCGKCAVRAQGELSPRTAEEAALLPDEGMRLACSVRVLGDVTVRLGEQGDIRVEVGASAGIPGDETAKTGDLGLAVDVGTTTVAAYLYDLREGRLLDAAGRQNVQCAYGSDVISRMEYGLSHPERADVLSRMLTEQIAELGRALAYRQGRAAERIRRVTVAGNTVMEHYAAGLDPSGMARSPFVPESLFGISYLAKQIFSSPFGDAEVYFCPCVSPFVGGDVTAGALASGVDGKACVLLADVGTNGEMLLWAHGRRFATSTAAGPAFEGAGLTCGMPALPGAVNAVRRTEDGFAFSTVDNAPVRGFCGSGILDLTAALLEAGAVDESGRMCFPEEAPEAVRPWMIRVGDQAAFRLEEGVVFTAGDVRALQTAKAAFRAGLEILLDRAGIGADEVTALRLAGGFGTRLDPASAARIGLIPRELLPVCVQAGNTAGAGAGLALCPDLRPRLEALASGTEWVDLNGLADFNDRFVEQMLF